MRVSATFALLAMGVAPAAAEDLYDKDGVQLWTSARLVTRDAATCHILEDRHPDEEYERLKVNEGQPLHVWRMDLKAANYSGKTIDYLRASVDVEAEWPPCTNWDWDTSQLYPGGVIWAGGLLGFQDVGEVLPGEEVGETMFLLVFHDEEPGFGRWSIDYDFGEAAPVPADRGAPGARAAPPSRSAPAAAAKVGVAAGRAAIAAAWRDVPRHASFGRYGSGDGGDSGGEFPDGLRVGGGVR